MSVYQGDFLGFRLGNDHSYNLNITRVSTNDRYSDNLIPTFQDATVQVPGGDGTYYWDTYYTQKTFTIDFAFDDLRDEDLRRLRQMFAYKGLKELVFDEFSYKKYLVKCAQPPQLKYICFDHMEFRIYKGEGTVQLVAYYPFAFGVETSIIYNKDIAIVNNLGDLPANIEVLYDLDNLANNSICLTLRETENITDSTIGYLELNDIIRYEGDQYLLINSRTQLIEGLDASRKKTQKLYNKYITTGDFFSPPPGRTYLFSENGVFTQLSYTPIFY